MSTPYSRSNPASAIPVYTVGAPGGQAGVPLGFQSVALPTGGPAAALPAPPAGAVYAVASSPQAFNWRDDGVAPTTTVGVAQPANTPLQVSRSQFAGFQAITLAGSSTTLSVSYYGQQAVGP